MSIKFDSLNELFEHKERDHVLEEEPGVSPGQQLMTREMRLACAVCVCVCEVVASGSGLTDPAGD